MTSGGILPFMRPDQYSRSLMECSSFIASSAFDDSSVRGRGFLARWSGSTAEFLSMWVLMMIGPRPFFLDERKRVRYKCSCFLPCLSGCSKTIRREGRSTTMTSCSLLSLKFLRRSQSNATTFVALIYSELLPVDMKLVCEMDPLIGK